MASPGVMADPNTANDTRGWIMALVSGIACVLGASIICVDSLVRLFPGKKDFRIQDSNTFLACSLSLSFGVMIFMSLYSMLPEARGYLEKAGLDNQTAGLILMACYVSGFVGIQIISRLFHRLIPSHVVDCDHSHDEQALERPSFAAPASRRQSSRARSRSMARTDDGENGSMTEATPLLAPEMNGHVHAPAGSDNGRGDPQGEGRIARPLRSRAATQDRRPSMMEMPHRVMSFVKDTKANCDESGPCFGYSDPCGRECLKHLATRSALTSRAPTFLHPTTSRSNLRYGFDRLAEDEDENDTLSPRTSSRRASRAPSRDPRPQQHRSFNHDSFHDHDHDQGHGHGHDEAHDTDECDSVDPDDLEAQHHHHVAENAFLSIGLQTSIAIALHKFPEGFITYATNHINPSLGVNVFLALFVHNVSEGFAMALPLYLALNNRLKAMMWAFVLGGLSQPLGAGVAVLWLRAAKHTHMEPDAKAYGCLFAITAGIMCSVALTLFVESLSLNHNRNLSIIFAFLGMSLLGISNAFVSHEH